MEGERENEREAVMYVRVGNPATRRIDQTDRQTERQIDGQTDEDADRLSDRQTERQTHR